MTPVAAIKRSLIQFRNNFLRTILTLLGIVFGVGAVVAMMSIGEGAQRQIVAQIESMGATSVHVNAKPIDEKEITNVINTSMGLTRSDAAALASTIPDVQKVAYRSRYAPGTVDLPVKASEVAVFGVTPNLIEVHNLKVVQGRGFHAIDHKHRNRCVVIGADLAKKLDSPLGSSIRIDESFFEVVGILKDAVRASDDDSDGVAFDATAYADAVLMPVETLYEELTPEPAHGAIDMISVQVETTDQTLRAKRSVSKLLAILHEGVDDFEVVAPEEILRQKRQTQSVFNGVLIAIAAISLLVGGIGVMNIMLANVMERISEIGVRRAVGARKRDIRNQFLFESITVCVIGGILGIILGAASSVVVAFAIDLPVAFAWESMFFAFVISVGVGVSFGLMPAIQAANTDPIEALRK